MKFREPLYCEFDQDKEIPILVDKHGEFLYIELRAYYGNLKNASIYHFVTRENAIKLRDAINKYLEGEE